MPVDNATRKQNRLRQYNSILQTGSVVEFPCDYCSSHCVDCVMASKNRNCAECTRRGRKCERKLHSDAEWDAVLRDEKKVAADLEKAQKQWLEYSMKMNETMAKVLRLQKQQQFLKDRSGRMLNHDSDVMAQLDEEDPPTAEDLAELDRLADEHDVRALAATSENPTLTQMLEMHPLSPSFWGDLDVSGLGGSPSPFAGGTVEPAGGSP
jgi:hypothetical protein